MSDQSQCPAGFYCHIGANAQTTVCCPALGRILLKILLDCLLFDNICCVFYSPCVLLASNPCEESKNEGEGNAYLIRYYFDRSQSQCLPFNYRGTKGSINNFVSKSQCEKACPPLWLNPCYGQPILDIKTNRPQFCHENSPCPQVRYIFYQ